MFSWTQKRSEGLNADNKVQLDDGAFAGALEQEIGQCFRARCAQARPEHPVHCDVDELQCVRVAAKDVHLVYMAELVLGGCAEHLAGEHGFPVENEQLGLGSKERQLHVLACSSARERSGCWAAVWAIALERALSATLQCVQIFF